jgi:hypothetical protein
MIKLPKTINTILLPPLTQGSGKSRVRYLQTPKLK